MDTSFHLPCSLFYHSFAMEIRANSSCQEGARSFVISARGKKKSFLHLVLSNEPPTDPEETKSSFERPRSLFRHESVLPGLNYCLGKRKKDG